MGSSEIIYEFGLQSDLFWDPLGEAEIKAAAEQGLSFFEIWGHVPWFDIHSSSMAAEFRAMVEANGMRIRSVHAPCEGDWDISSEDESVRVSDEIIQFGLTREEIDAMESRVRTLLKRVDAGEVELY